MHLIGVKFLIYPTFHIILYTHTHTHTHTYIYIERDREREGNLNNCQKAHAEKKAEIKIHLNGVCSYEQILETAIPQTAALWGLNFHLSNHQSTLSNSRFATTGHC